MKGKRFSQEGSGKGAVLDRLAVFRVTYIAFLVLVLLYVFSVAVAESVLEYHFQDRISRAISQVRPGNEHPAEQLHRQVRRHAEESAWVRLGGVEVTAIVVAADGTPLYLTGFDQPEPSILPSEDPIQMGARLLPPTTHVEVAVPHNSLVANTFLVGYAAAVLTALYFRQRTTVARQEALLREAVTTREEMARRAEAIESELENARRRAAESTLVQGEHAREIESLRSERATLREKLSSLEQREAELLGTSASQELASEHQALEELLDEALTDLQGKDEQIQQLQSQLKRASRDASAAATARSREVDLLARRLRTLYRNLEVDDRAISDLVALRDDGMKLKAEEALKRLSDDVGTAGARRKVGGLPPGLPVFELGYAGKGRIYYTHGSQRRLRVLCIGAKNTQKPDLEYLSRVVRGRS